ncbi:hypothetical protein [Halobacillus dabanensis]|nr:hypothetical protein [Halobacillus dabanensis]
MAISDSISVYRWLRRKRHEKKKTLYKQSWQLVVDPVVLFYSALFVIFCFFIGYDWLKQLLPLVQAREGFVERYVLILPFIIGFNATLQAWTDPCLRFTTSELLLSLLPHSRQSIVKYLIIEKIAVQSIITLCIALFVGILMPFTPSDLLLWTLLYLSSIPLSVLVQWKLFSQNRWMKALAFLFIGGLIPLFFVGTTPLILYSLLLLAVLLILFKKGEPSWDRVAEVNDARVWNMWIVSQMTNVQVKSGRRFGATQNDSEKDRNPDLSVQKLYERIWIGHFRRSSNYICQTIPVLMVITAVVPWQVNWMLVFTLPLAVLIYQEVATGIFADLFQQENAFQSLPIDERNSVSSYLRWVYIGFLPILMAFVGVQWALGEPIVVWVIQLLGISLWVYHDMKKVIHERLKIILKENFFRNEWMRGLGFLILAAGIYHPSFMIFLPLLLLYPNLRARLKPQREMKKPSV